MSNHKTPKILFLKRSILQNGGLEKATRALLDGFIEKGCEVHSATLDSSPYSSVLNHKLSSAKNFLSYRKILSFDNQTQKIARDKNFGCVFGVEQTSYQTHYRAGNGCHKRYLSLRKTKEGFLKGIFFHLNPLHQLLLKIEKTTFENPDLKCLFTNSHMVKHQILDHYNVDSKKIHVVHNGVEWENLESPFSSPAPYQHLNLNPHIPQLLFIGHNFLRKGLPFLLQALSKINEPFHLSVVGKDKNLTYYKKLCSSLRLDHKVSFWGSQENTLPFYQCANIVLIPSIYDPFANVTVEALAMGCYVITSKTNGGHEVLTKNTGKVIENLENIDEWVSSISSIIKIKHDKLSIRNSIKYLDYSTQLDKLITKTLETI